jgi:hypothetical protein
LVGHLFGIALGAGGAFISDLLFLKSVRDRRISTTEMNFLLLASYCVTGGLILLILSGAGLFSLDSAEYLASSKFLAKITIVGIITSNGVFLHAVHIPRLRRPVGAQSVLAHEFSPRMLLLMSGVISTVSWASAIVLGAFESIPLSYEVILGGYGVILLFGLLFAYALRDHLIPS